MDCSGKYRFLENQDSVNEFQGNLLFESESVKFPLIEPVHCQTS